MAEARAACDRLVVGLNSDASVTRLKGTERPMQDVASRAEVLAALEAVDLVVVFEEDTPLELIRQVRPAVLVKGGDYTRDEVVGREIVEADGGEVILVDLVPGPQHDQHGRAVGRSAKTGTVSRPAAEAERAAAERDHHHQERGGEYRAIASTASRSATSASWSIPAAATARC